MFLGLVGFLASFGKTARLLEILIGVLTIAVGYWC